MTRAVFSILLVLPLVSAGSAQGCPKAPEGRTAWFDTCKYLFSGGDVKVQRPLSTPDPEYTETARKKKIQGTVVVAVALNAQGTIDDIKVVRSLEPSLDQSSVNAVRQWKFAPATKDGQPVAVQFEIETTYRTY